MKLQTIPRLELLSALLLARLMESVTNSPTCYTDSKVALYTGFWVLTRYGSNLYSIMSVRFDAFCPVIIGSTAQAQTTPQTYHLEG